MTKVPQQCGISPDVIEDVRRLKMLRVMEWDEDGKFIRDCSVPSVAGDAPGWLDKARQAGRNAKEEVQGGHAVVGGAVVLRVDVD